MRRRDFITLVGASAVALSRTVNADPTRQVRRLGFLAATAESDPEFRPLDAAFWQRLQELGWRDGSNLHLDRRWAAGDAGRAQINAAELVGLAPDLIFALGTPALVALRKNTRTIPIVFVGVSDPVGQGFVTNLARPGGNLTGFTHFEPTFGTKWLGLLKEIVADLVRVSVIFNPQTASHAGLFLRALESVAPAFAIDVSAAPIHDMPEVEATLKALVQRPGAGLVFPPDVFTVTNREPIISLVAKYHLPAVYSLHAFAVSGGLVSYGTDLVRQGQQAADYVDRIFKGANPGDLPVQQPNKYQLAINLKAANSLGVPIPPTLLALADEVIE